MEFSLFLDYDFDAEKAAHLAAFLLLRAREPISAVHGVGLLHLANVLAERSLGAPLVEDRVAVFGPIPVPQNIAALVRGRGLYSRSAQWSELIDQVPDHSIWPARSVSIGDLHRLESREMRILDTVWYACSDSEPFSRDDWFFRKHAVLCPNIPLPAESDAFGNSANGELTCGLTRLPATWGPAITS